MPLTTSHPRRAHTAPRHRPAPSCRDRAIDDTGKRTGAMAARDTARLWLQQREGGFRACAPPHTRVIVEPDSRRQRRTVIAARESRPEMLETRPLVLAT